MALGVFCRGNLIRLRPLDDDGGSDVEAYNRELSQLGDSTWFNVPWLYAECYLYRYILFSPEV